MVEEIFPGLMRGYFSRFTSPDNRRDPCMPEWLAVCTHALLLTREPAPVPKAAPAQRPAGEIPPAPEPLPVLANQGAMALLVEACQSDG
jgi:hypothetical protein